MSVQLKHSLTRASVLHWPVYEGLTSLGANIQYDGSCRSSVSWRHVQLGALVIARGLPSCRGNAGRAAHTDGVIKAAAPTPGVTIHSRLTERSRDDGH